MCIECLKPIPALTGIGYKLVRKLAPGTYASWFTSFHKEDGGCSYGNHLGSGKYDGAIYEKGKPYRVKHTRMTRTTWMQPYRAGVHVWLNIKDALEKSGGGGVVVEVSWKRPFAYDGTTIVVREITVIGECNPTKKETEDDKNFWNTMQGGNNTCSKTTP